MGNLQYPYEQQAEATPRQKYELPEEDLKAGPLKRLSVGLLIAGVFVLLKDLLFSWSEAATAGADNVANIPRTQSNEPPSLALVETPEPIDQGAREQHPSPIPDPTQNWANGPATSVNPASAVERPTYAGPAQIQPGSGRPLAATNDNASVVGSDVNDLPPQVGTGLPGSRRDVGDSGFDGAPVPGGDTTTAAPRPIGNRAPVVTRPARLNSLLVGQTVIIAAATLLQNVIDADADVLSIQNLTASSGGLVETGAGTWSFTPDPNDTTEVTFTYDVTDGTVSTPQTALLDLLPLPAEAPAGADAPATIGGTPADGISDAGDQAVLADAGDETINGNGGDNQILGSADDDVIFGGAGDDTILAGDGNDTIFGGDGNDVILGGSGQDLIFAEAGDDIVDGGDGNDQIVATISDGNDSYTGGAGTDTYDLSRTEAAAVIDLTSGTASSAQTGHDSLSDIENVVGGAGDDTIVGSDANNVVQGGSGSDEIDGGAGDDQFIATVSDGDDTYSGGAGTDTYDLSGTEAAAVIDLTSGTASSAQTGHDNLSDIENVVGGAGDDTIVGSVGNNVIQGGLGSDEIDGGAGDDQFIATVSDGDDTYSGGAGTDTYDLSETKAGVVVDLTLGTADGVEIGHDNLSSIENVVGGAGDDVFRSGGFFNMFTGGAGNDIFVFRALLNANAIGLVRDQITDFQVGDKIDLSGFDALLMLAGNPDFELVVDKMEFSDTGKVEVRFQGFGEDEHTVVDVKIDGNGVFDTEIELHGRHDLTKDDFIGVS